MFFVPREPFKSLDFQVPSSWKILKESFVYRRPIKSILLAKDHHRCSVLIKHIRGLLTVKIMLTGLEPRLTLKRIFSLRLTKKFVRIEYILKTRYMICTWTQLGMYDMFKDIPRHIRYVQGHTWDVSPRAPGSPRNDYFFIYYLLTSCSPAVSMYVRVFATFSKYFPSWVPSMGILRIKF